MSRVALILALASLCGRVATAQTIHASQARAFTEAAGPTGLRPGTLILSSDRSWVVDDTLGLPLSETWRLQLVSTCSGYNESSREIWRTSREWFGRLVAVGEVKGFVHASSSGDTAFVILIWLEGTDAGLDTFCADIYRIPLSPRASSPPSTPAARLRRLSARNFTLKLRDVIFGDTGVSILADIYGGMREYRYDWTADAWFEARGTDEPVAAEDLKPPLDPPTRPPNK